MSLFFSGKTYLIIKKLEFISAYRNKKLSVFIIIRYPELYEKKKKQLYQKRRTE